MSCLVVSLLNLQSEIHPSFNNWLFFKYCCLTGYLILFYVYVSSPAYMFVINCRKLAKFPAARNCFESFRLRCHCLEINLNTPRKCDIPTAGNNQLHNSIPQSQNSGVPPNHFATAPSLSTPNLINR